MKGDETMSSSRDGYAVKMKVDEGLSDGMGRLAASIGDMSRALDDAGASLVTDAFARFEAERGPDGQPWTPLSDVTLLLRRRKLIKNEVDKSKAKTDKGIKAANYKARGKVDGLMRAIKILNDSGDLKGGISHRFSNDFVEVGTDRPYGRIQHLGGSAKGFIKGQIPARPFLPDFSQGSADARLVLGVVERHLSKVKE